MQNILLYVSHNMKEISIGKKILEWKYSQDKYMFFENDIFEIETAMYFIFFSGLESLSFWGVKFI